jgi:ASTRA-associated protein 1
MKELAVLKWHREGCYAVAFGKIIDGVERMEKEEDDNEEGEREKGEKEKETEMILRTVEERRREKVREGHWLVGGAKDGKVSLWEIY